MEKKDEVATARPRRQKKEVQPAAVAEEKKKNDETVASSRPRRQPKPPAEATKAEEKPRRQTKQAKAAAREPKADEKPAPRKRATSASSTSKKQAKEERPKGKGKAKAPAASRKRKAEPAAECKEAEPAEDGQKGSKKRKSAMDEFVCEENRELALTFYDLSSRCFKKGDRFAGMSYAAAAKTIRTFPEPITFADQLFWVPGIDKRAKYKIEEFLENGYIEALERMR